MVVESLFEQLSKERKQLQVEGYLPEWFTTQGWQLFKEKYLHEAKGYTDTIQRIVDTAAQYTDSPESWSKRFFEIMEKGWLAPSTPVAGNMGTNKGCSVSCSGGKVQDSVYGFYESQQEVALLSKNGFGTSSYLGDIRERGSVISTGGTASGILPVLKGFVNVANDISQGSSRRGAWAGYVPVLHGDFWEVADHLWKHPENLNIGWILTKEFEELLDSGDEDALARWQRIMKIRAVHGKGYMMFKESVDNQQPIMYADQGLECLASQLCTEIFLHSDDLETYTCVLSSMNVSKYDEWKDTDAVFVATVFLDCVAQDFIEKGKDIRGLKKAVRFTERHRALGLGTLGFHTYLQDKMIPIESMEAHFINMDIYSHLQEESLRASKWMAERWGEPEVCKGYGLRNTHRTAIAPNMSSALLAGGVSQGVEPIYENVYEQGSAAGDMFRINPSLLPIMKERGQYTDGVLTDIIDNKGSVQHVEWLTEQEKEVFKTAFEIDQKTLIRLASTRQQYICQGQSLNLFFAADESEEYISEVHKLAFKDERIKSLYYLRSKAGVQASKECVACEG